MRSEGPEELSRARTAVHKHLLSVGSGDKNRITLSNVQEDYVESPIGELQYGQPHEHGQQCQSGKE